ncbi:MAG: ROK family protein [Synoicihabitans sp.]
MDHPNLIGIEIGGTKLQIVRGTTAGEITERHRFDVDKSRGAEGIREQIAATLPGLAGARKPDAIGIGFGGPTNWRTGQIVLSHHVPGWNEFPLAPWTSKLAGGVPTFVDNDANVACLGESHRGAGQEHNSVFYVTLGSGVGGGFTQDGKILHGGGATETEIGHLRLDRDGTIVESRCSGWAIDQRIRDLITESPFGVLAQRVTASSAAPATHLVAALRANDPLAARIIREVGEDLGFGLSHVTQLLSPQVIVIGGGLSLIGAALISAIQTGLNAHVMEALQPAPLVSPAGLGEDVVPTGALLLAAHGLASATA